MDIRKILKLHKGKNNNRKRIYLDYAAATPLDLGILKKMEPYFNIHFGNPGALHKEGIEAKRVLTDARARIAQSILSKPEEVIFTAGGTEGNNLAILGYINTLKEKIEKGGTSIKDVHVITSSAEHPSVLDCFRSLKAQGVQVDMIDFNTQGIVEPKKVRKLLRKETLFASISYVNSEIGTVQPIKDIAKEIRAHEKETGASIVFHTDASQAPLYFDCTPSHLGVDLMTIDGQKIYGPKGVGFLYKKDSVSLSPIMKGGSQEHGLRPGTENVPLIVGMVASFIEATQNREKEVERIKILQDHFITLLTQHIPDAVLNGSRSLRSPNNINISIPGMDGEYLVVALDEHGIAAATKSACLEHTDIGHSYVVESLYINKQSKAGLGATMAKSAIRFSLGRSTTKKDIEYTVSVLLDERQKIDKVVL